MMRRYLPLLILSLAAGVLPQSGGQFQITQSAISNGGGTSGGGTFSLTGTIGQTVAGTTSNGSPFGHNSGFWQAFVAPTAAPVSVQGRLVTAEGRAVSRTTVTLDDGAGTSRNAVTTSFGYFQFDSVESGRTYILSVRHPRYQFAPQLLNVSDNIRGIVLTPIR